MNLNSNELQRKLNLFDSVLLVITNVLGAGIFITPVIAQKSLQNETLLLLAWIFGGIYAIIGALCVAELGVLFPKAGGDYVFLKETYGKYLGFLYGWSSFFITFSGIIAILSKSFGEYFTEIFSGQSLFKLEFFFFSITPVELSGIFAILFLSLAHYSGLRTGITMQNIITLLKIFGIFLIIALGFLTLNGHLDKEVEFKDSHIKIKDIAPLIMAITFTYSGWNAICYVGGEVKNPSKNIPMSLILGNSIIIFIYILVNLAFFKKFSSQEIGEKSNLVFFIAPEGMKEVVSFFISLIILGCLSAQILIAPRIYFSMAKDGLFFKIFGKIKKETQVPDKAIFLQCIVSIILTIIAGFEKILIFTTLMIIIFSALLVFSVVILRIKHPEIKRDFKTPFYQFLPGFFVTICVFMIIWSIISSPWVSLISITIMLAGYPFFLLWKKFR